MRRWINVPLILGLLLTLLPSAMYAQEATPVVTETSTVEPSEPVVTETEPAIDPTETPTETTESTELPAGRNQDAGLSASQVDAPILTLNGEAASIIVPLGTRVLATTESGAHLRYYLNTQCVGNGVREASSLETAPAYKETSMSFRAYWTDQLQAPASECFSILWQDQIPTIAPTITVDGEAESKTIPLDTTVNVAPEQAATLWEYADATCVSGATWISTSPMSFSEEVPGTRYFKAYWTAYPGAPGSECLSVTWDASAPAVPPILTIDGIAENRTVPVLTLIVARTEAGADLSLFDGATCAGTAFQQGGELMSTRRSEPSSISFKATWIDDPGAPESECLSATWIEHSPTVAPNLTINGVASSQTFDNGTHVTITTEPGATFWWYLDTSCAVLDRNYGSYELNLAYNQPTSFSFRAHWTDKPDVPASDCLSVTWQDPAPTVAPTLTIDGASASKTVPFGTSIIASPEPGASMSLFSGTTCSGSPYHTGSGQEEIMYDRPMSISFQARWTDYPGAPPSECLTATWETPAQTVAPNLTIDGEAASKTVPFGTTIVASTEPNAFISVYWNGTCSDTPGFSDDEPVELTYDVPMLVFFQARWTDYPNTPASECLSVTWAAPAPTVAPTLTIDGEAQSKTVPSGTSVTVAPEPGGSLWMFEDTACTVGGNWESSTSVSYEQDFAGSLYFQARWTDYPNAPASECLSVTWEVPAPTVAPTLTIDGKPEGKTVPIDTVVLLQAETGSALWMFSGMTCDVDAWNTGVPSIRYTSNTAATYSIQARWINQPEAPASECLTVTWETPAPTVAPTLTIDGVSESKTVPLDTSVTVAPETGASLWQYDDATCVTGGAWQSPLPVDYATSGPETKYFQARWADFPNAPASECLSVTWEVPTATETPTPPVTETPTPVVTESPTPVETPTPIATETPSPTATVAPTETSTETSVPQEKQTTVRIEMWDGSSIEGAIWNLYAPVASQSAVNPYLTGVVGPNNTAVFTDLPVGEYRFVAMPEGTEAQDFTIVVSDSSEEIVLQFAQPATPVPGTSPTTTSVPAVETPADQVPTAAAVTGLPETGSGSQGTSVIIALAGLLTAAMGVMFIGRRSTRA